MELSNTPFLSLKAAASFLACPSAVQLLHPLYHVTLLPRLESRMLALWASPPCPQPSVSAPLLVCHPQEDVPANLSPLTLASPRPSVPHTSAWSTGDYFSHTLQHPQVSQPPLQPLLFSHCSSCAVSSLNPLTRPFC